MMVSELPPYLLKPYQKSRMNSHVQTMAFIQLVKFGSNAGRTYEIGVVENVVTSRARASEPGSPWTRWAEDKHDDTASALKVFENAVTAKERQDYRSIVDQGLLLPMNDTDLRHFRATGTPPRAALEYGSPRMDAIFAWWQAERAKAVAEHAATAECW